MATTDITAPGARMKAIIEGLPAVGLVHGFDLYSRKDLRPLIVSKIAGVDVLRAWWFTGPQMVGRPMVQDSAGWIERTWRWSIHGIEGLNEDGSSLVTLRANALAVADAIDVERDLSHTCHRTQPVSFQIGPEDRAAWKGIGVSYVVMTKEVVTLSTP